MHVGAPPPARRSPASRTARRYTFRVKATNAVGSSPRLGASNARRRRSRRSSTSPRRRHRRRRRHAVELGIKFRADSRRLDHRRPLLQAAGNTGTHVGSLWTDGRQRLAQATFTSESASGWQAVTFASPVAVTAGTTYVASYFSPDGRYTAHRQRPRLRPSTTAPLHTVANATSANGVYAYGAASSFPTSTLQRTNYWVDVMYALPPPGQVTGVERGRGRPTSANVTLDAARGRRAGELVPDHAVRRRDRADAEDRHRLAATSASVAGPHHRHRPTRSRVQARQRQRRRPESAPSNAVTPSDPVAPMAPTGVAAKPATQLRARHLDRAGERRRQPDHGPDRDAVRRRRRAGRRSRSGRPRRRHGRRARQRHGYTFQVTATNAVGTSAAVGGLQRRHAAGDDLRLRRRRRRRTPATPARSSSA